MTDLIQIREYCLRKPFSTEGFPFDNSTLVFKVFGKMFALIDIFSLPLEISLKCDPILAIQLREKYSFISPGYHLNKIHWITVTIDEKCRPQLILDLIDNSYKEVVKKLPKKIVTKY